MRNFLSLSLLVFAAGLIVAAQESYVIVTPEKKPEPSLAEQARKAVKPTTAKAKTVFTNDNLHGESASPFPLIRAEQDDSEAILKSMINYRYGHTAKETEDAIRKWFDIHSGKLADMKNEMTQIRERQSNRYSYPEYARSETDYRRIAAQQRADMLTMQNDQQIMNTNSRLSQRIYATLQKVNSGLRRANLNYEWFVARTMYDDYSY